MTLILTLFAIALILFFFEIFVPGGILAILGIIFGLIASGLIWEQYGGFAALISFGAVVLFSIVFFFLEVALISRGPLAKLFVLSKEQKSYGETYARFAEVVGKQGETVTVLAPSGIVLVEGERYDAKSRSGYLQKGERIDVIGHEGTHLFVRKLS